MSSRDDIGTNNTDDILVITDQEGEALTWDGNNAKIPGLLHECGKYYVRKGLFQPLFAHRAVVLSNGNNAISDIKTSVFITGQVDDPQERSFENICPEISARVANVDADRAANGLAAFTWPTTNTPGSGFIVNKLSVNQEDGKLLRSLAHVFGHAIASDELLDAAAGSGLAFKAALVARAATATTADRAIVTSNFDKTRAEGVQGELTLDSLKRFVKRYRRALRDLDPAQRPGAAAEVHMMNLIAFKDDSMREIYEVRTTSSPPATLDAAVTIIQNILTSRVRAEELNQQGESTGALGSALAAARQPPAATPAAPDLQALLTALVAKLAVPDPNKPPTGGPKNKSRNKPREKKNAGRAEETGKPKIPRDKDNQILRWVAGMSLCKCGGKHLYRDCDKDWDALGLNKDSSAKDAGAAEHVADEQVLARIQAMLNDGTIREAGVCEATDDDAYVTSLPVRPLPGSPPSPSLTPRSLISLAGEGRAACQRGGGESRGPGGCTSGCHVPVSSGVSSCEVNHSHSHSRSHSRSDLIWAHWLLRSTRSASNADSIGPEGRLTARLSGHKNELGCPGRLSARPGDLENKHLRPSAYPKGSVTSWSHAGGLTQIDSRPVHEHHGQYDTFHSGSPAASASLGSHDRDAGTQSYLPDLGPDFDSVNNGVNNAVNNRVNDVDTARSGEQPWRQDRGGLPQGREPAQVDGAIAEKALALESTTTVSDTKTETRLDGPDVGLLLAHPDSGCTGSATPDKSLLINRRPCRELFRAADKKVVMATCIGDLPVLAKTKTGKLVYFKFTNVRCVPDFGYTLLSVKQLWREQSIDSRFADVNALVLPAQLGRHVLPFTTMKELPTVVMVSAVKVAELLQERGSTPTTPAVSTALPAELSTPAPRAHGSEETPASTPSKSDTATPDAPSRRDTIAAEAAASPGARSQAPSPGLLMPPPRDSLGRGGAGLNTGELPGSPPSGPTSSQFRQGQPVAAPVTVPQNPQRETSRDDTRGGGVSSRPLGWHRVGSTSHVAKLPASQAAELMYRRSKMGLNKLRALAHTTSDAPKVLASAPAVPISTGHAQASIKRASHSGSLDAPAPEPGVLHFDIKEMIVSIGGYRYIVFLIDEHSRYVFYDFVKRKSEAAASVARCVAAFDAKVGTRLDDNGRPLPRPRVRAIHSDREGKLMSLDFSAYRAVANLHHTTSPPHDHDLNPIVERIIGHTWEIAAAIKIDSHAVPRLWPWLISYAVDWHNASITSVGSSTADANISPFQRFTHELPRVMDLPAFGCRAVALAPPNQQHKPSLSGRGYVGAFLGRSRNSKGAYDILVDNNRIVTTSSVLVNEEYFDWAPAGEKHKPLSSVSHAAPGPGGDTLPLPFAASGSNVSAVPTFSSLHRTFLNLFSGPYGRADGLTAAMTAAGWDKVTQVDNDGERGGGWGHDLLNDSYYSNLLSRAAAGEFETMMIAFPCSTFSVSRFFDATNTNGGDRGPPVIRTLSHPDGLPEGEIDPKHIRELRLSNLLLERTINIAIAARRSPARTTIVFENPADRSPGAGIASSNEFKEHGAVFRTSAFKRLESEIDMSGSATFAYCRLGSEHQKYTTLRYSPEAGAVLDTLNGPDYMCNHERGSHSKRAGGRGPSGDFVSSEAAAYPRQLCSILAKAFTVARSGGEVLPPKLPPGKESTETRPHAREERQTSPTDQDAPLSSPLKTLQFPSPAVSASGADRPSVPTARETAAPLDHGVEPISFPSLGERAPANLRFDNPGVKWQQPSSPPVGIDGRAKRATAMRASGASYFEGRARKNVTWKDLESVAEEVAEPLTQPSHSPGGTSTEGYSPFKGSVADVMEEAVAESVYDAHVAASAEGSRDSVLVPVTDWHRVDGRMGTKLGKRLPGGGRMVQVNVAVPRDDHDPDKATLPALSALLAHALRADSPDAPASHEDAMRNGQVWIPSEKSELANHKKNESWETITIDELPPGRKIHRFIWVYKVKRDGTAKSRLCVQGSSLEAGVDYQQVFSAALRYSSARALFALAARLGCKVRSVDLVAAYLQGRFVDGEVVFCHLPPGYPEYDQKGRPKIAKVVKPIYGIQQAGRRLQRMLFDWFKRQGFVSLDDSDPCIFSLPCADGETLVVGVYVDNLQIVHSAELDEHGRGPSGCAYNTFMDKLFAEWEVTDEGPMTDLLGIEVEYNNDESITLHQRAYIEKIVKRFLPDGPLAKAQRNGLPYSASFLEHINEALTQTNTEYPNLVEPMQQRIGCLMYATTSTRPDIAYAVHQLCKCMHKPTPALLGEVDHVLSYLARTASLGLTYSREHASLRGYADASWETRTSTSGWTVLWQSAALTWGSRKQKSIALSTCEAEIIALSEAAKDVVYLRKLVKGLGAGETGPTPLATDSKSARDVSYNPEHHDRMKHVERRHFFVRDMVEKFELEVPYVPTNLNPSDFLTKPMKSAAQFRALRKIVMNTRN